jgi:hypothetical protein
MGHLPTLAVGLTQQGREVDAMRKAPAAGERVRTRHPIFARTRTQRQTDLVRLVGHAATLCANDSADHRTKDLPYAITHRAADCFYVLATPIRLYQDRIESSGPGHSHDRRHRSRQAERPRWLDVASDPRAGSEKRGARPPGTGIAQFHCPAAQQVATLGPLRVGPQRASLARELAVPVTRPGSVPQHGRVVCSQRAGRLRGSSRAFSTQGYGILRCVT